SLDVRDCFSDNSRRSFFWGTLPAGAAVNAMALRVSAAIGNLNITFEPSCCLFSDDNTYEGRPRGRFIPWPAGFSVQPVDRQRHAVNRPSLIRGKKHNRVGQRFRFNPAAVVGIRDGRAILRGIDHARQHAVDVDAGSFVVRLTESVSADVKASGINVNCVLPGMINTPQNRAAIPDADHSRWVEPEALADAIMFLASDEARAIHGVALPVYGLN